MRMHITFIAKGLHMRVVIAGLILLISGCSAPLQSTGNPSEGLVYAPKPLYPSQAYQKRLTGIVKVKYDVDASGKTYNVAVIQEWPKGYFKESALQSVSKMKYIENHPKQGLIINIKYRLVKIIN